MKKISIKPARPIYPSPAALITCVDTQGRPNIITLGEVFNISIAEPVIVGIATRSAQDHCTIEELTFACDLVYDLVRRHGSPA